MRFTFIALLLAACGDKDGSGSVDSDPVIDSEDSEPSDSDVPTLTASLIFSAAWGSETPFGGYAAGVSDSGWLLAAPAGQFLYRVPLDAGQGLVIEDSADLVLAFSNGSPDKLSPALTGGWIGFADAGYDRPSTQEDDSVLDAGALRLLREESLAALSGDADVGDVAEISVVGDCETAYTGSSLVVDLDGDGFDDLLVSSDCGEGRAGIWSDFSALSGEIGFESADLLVDACESGEYKYGPMSPIVFGDGYLALGCAVSNYRSGYFEIYALPLVGGDIPVQTVTNVSGWWAASPGLGHPICFDVRGSHSLACVNEAADEIWSIVSEEGDGLGSGVSALLTGDGRPLFAFGAQRRKDKAEEETGSTYVCEGAPSSLDDCIELATPSDVGLSWLGAVTDLHETPDGRVLLLSAGWQYGTGDGGGAAGWELNWE